MMAAARNVDLEPNGEGNEGGGGVVVLIWDRVLGDYGQCVIGPTEAEAGAK